MTLSSHDYHSHVILQLCQMSDIAAVGIDHQETAIVRLHSRPHLATATPACHHCAAETHAVVAIMAVYCRKLQWWFGGPNADEILV
jgi:hypothetical protein